MNGVIMSPTNPEIKRLKRLGKPGERHRLGLFMVEGRRVIDGFLDHGWKPEQILIESGHPVPDAWQHFPLRAVGERVIKTLASSSTAPGYLAVFSIPRAQAWCPQEGGLLLCGVADPGNVGTLIRSAVAFGRPQVVLWGGADPFSPKVVQASAGALAGARLRRIDAVDDLTELTGPAPLAGLTVSHGQPVDSIFGQPVWLAVGSEAHGLPSSLIERCHYRITLPMPGGVESLNAAVAGSIALYQLAVRSALG